MNESDLRSRLREVPIPSGDEARDRTIREAVDRSAEPEPKPVTRSKRRPVRIAILAAAGAIAILVAADVLGGTAGTTPSGDSLGSLAAIAAEQPQQQIQYVKWTSELRYDRPDHWAQGARYPEQILDTLESEVWVGADRRFEQDTRSYWDGEDIVREYQYLSDTPTDLYCFTAYVEGDPPECAALSGFNGIFGPGGQSQLPTDPEALAAALNREFRNPGPDDRPEDTPPGACEPAKVDTAPVPFSMTATSDRQTLLTDLRAAAGLTLTDSGSTYFPPKTERMFTATTALLASPDSTPELRAAAFELVAELDGAELTTGGQDRLGREASVIRYSSPPPEPSEGRYARDELYVDPATSQVLEQRTSVVEDDGTDAGQVVGTYSRLFEERSEVGSFPPSAGALEAAMRAQCRS